jgi:hypothetical protein
MSPTSDGVEVFDFLLGQTLDSVDGATKGSERIIVKTAEGRKFEMFHDHDCCESVEVEDVCGEIEELLNSPITMAESVSNNTDAPPDAREEDSWTWTFYKLGTAKGSVTIRWFGSSNGYYSERVTFAEARNA